LCHATGYVTRSKFSLSRNFSRNLFWVWEKL